MIYSIKGIILGKGENFVVIEAGGIGFKLYTPKISLERMPQAGVAVQVFSYLHVKQDGMELYGFSNESELKLFEKLISVSGIGPKSALGIMGIAEPLHIIAAINEGKTDLLTKVSGVGKKTAERVILELRGKISIADAKSAELVTLMESDTELEETLVGLGYTRAQARDSVSKINPSVKGFKERLKEALRKSR